MSGRARRSFEEKAPLVDASELTEMFHAEVMPDELEVKARSVWLIGSFANPAKQIDTNDIEWSDLDVFVVVPDWQYPQADTGIVLHATAPTLPDFVERNVESEEWKGVAGPEPWDCSVDAAWERLPDYARRTLTNSVKNGFFRTEEELESGKIRYFDVFIGTREQLDYQRQKDLSEGDELPGFRLWSEDGDAPSGQQ